MGAASRQKQNHKAEAAPHSIKGSSINQDSHELTVSVLSSIEFAKALKDAYSKQGREIRDVPAKDLQETTIMLNCKTYTVVMANIIRRIIRSGTVAGFTEARNYLAKNAGESPEGALTNDIITTPEFAGALKDAYAVQGREIKNIPTNDNQNVTVTIHGQKYTVNMYNIVQRTLYSGIFARRSEARDYLAKNAGEIPEKTLPNDVITTPEFAKALMDAYAAHGRAIKDVPAGDPQDVTVAIGGRNYTVNMNMLTVRMIHSGTFERGAEGRDYLAKNAGEIPEKTPPNDVITTPEFAKALMDAYAAHGRAIKDVPIGDPQKIIVRIDRTEYTVSMESITRRIVYSGTFVGLAEGRDYLALLAVGIPVNEAIRIAKEGTVVETLLEESYDALSKKFNVEEALALLKDDPLKMKALIKLVSPELSDDEVDRLIIHTFKGLVQRGGTGYEQYREYQVGLNFDISEDIPESSDAAFIEVRGRATNATHVYVSGSWNKRKKVDNDGTFAIRVPLGIGKLNRIEICTINIETEKRSEFRRFEVQQTGDSDEISALVSMLSALSAEREMELAKDSVKFSEFAHLLEHSLVRKFSPSFEEGVRYVAKLIRSTKSGPIKEIIEKILSDFETINENTHVSLAPGESLLFFQKYCLYKLDQARRSGKRGVILANDPGLGKTVVALVAANGGRTVVVSPNSIVQTWIEQGEKFLAEPNVTGLHFGSHENRKRILKAIANTPYMRGATRASRTVVVNQEFLRNVNDDERFGDMNLHLGQQGILIIDEAHWKTNTGTKQSEGVSKLKPAFTMLLSATPYRNPETLRRMMYEILPDDIRFKSAVAFRRSFSRDNVSDLRLLNALTRQYVIRFRKRDAFEICDYDEPLAEIVGKMPIVNEQKKRQFTLTYAQSMAIFQMMCNWDDWCRTYQHYIPLDANNRADGVFESNMLQKRHALRLMMNNPMYVGENKTSPKRTEIDGVVREAISEGRKVILFCRYINQVEAYRESFGEFKPSIMTGLQREEGEMRDEQDNVIRYRKGADGRGWELDTDGYPVRDPAGEPMSVLDYEKLTFMNAEERRIIICTYGTGGMGLTLNVAKAVVLDDLPDTYVEEYQAVERANRMFTSGPETRTHHDVKVYKVTGRYPDRFIEKMQRTWLKKEENGTYTVIKVANETSAERQELLNAYDHFFRQGTLDDFLFENLATQKTVYTLLLDGIGREEEEDAPDMHPMLRQE
jgi:hypothetical protein